MLELKHLHVKNRRHQPQNADNDFYNNDVAGHTCQAIYVVHVISGRVFNGMIRNEYFIKVNYDYSKIMDVQNHSFHREVSTSMVLKMT